jgi:hypothetical protein
MPSLQDAFGRTSGGLDRASMHVYTSVDAKARDEQLESSRYSTEVGRDTHVASDNRSGAIDSIGRMSRRFRSKLHKKPKEAHLPSSRQRNSDAPTLVPTLAPSPPETSNQDRFSEPPPEKPGLPPLKEFVTNPVQTTKTIVQAHGGDETAQNLAKAAASHEASVRVVRAYDKIAETATDREEELARKDLELLKKARQDSYVRWTLDRHIHKVERLRARPTPRRSKEDFLVVDEHGQEAMRWDEYGKHVCLLVS